jgi:plastocyanin
MKRIKWIFGLAAIVVAAFVCGFITLDIENKLASAASLGEKSASSTEVKIDNFSFGPPNLNIPAGTTITWTNHDDVPHVVASDDKIFKSKALDTDDHFSFTFTKPGTYNYYCAIHPKMTAKIVVQ